jgi:hypothetical protein
MPKNPKNKSANERFAAWINQGLKRQNWSARRVIQMALLLVLGVMVAALYLVQSSQIVTSTRQVQLLREELAAVQRENADLALKISAAATRAQLQQRATALGFALTENVMYVAVPHLPADDSPSIERVYSPR